jgi:hypothetical protein
LPSGAKPPGIEMRLDAEKRVVDVRFVFGG